MVEGLCGVTCGFSSSDEVEMCVGWLVGKGDGVFITDLGVELEDDEFDDDIR